MRPFFQATIAIFLVLFVAIVCSKDDTEFRFAAAKPYLVEVPVAQIMDNVMQQAAAMKLPENKRAEFLADVKEALNIDFLAKVSMAAMVKQFTAEKRNALADFYGSPVGACISSKFGPYMADIMPPLQAQVRRALQEMLNKPKYRRS